MQDVKLRNAFCLCHVLRMHAPETPYDNNILEVSCLSLPLWMLEAGKLNSAVALCVTLAALHMSGHCYVC